jgi:DNA-binding GntR family transcriptional regulator
MQDVASGLVVRRPSDGRRLSSYVYDALRERLLSGELHGGDNLAVEEIKSELGVSKQPVMDALRRLEAGGLVQIIPQVGCRVLSYTPEEVSDFFNIFSSLEAETTAVAARRHTPQQVEQLCELNEQIRLAAQDRDLDRRAQSYLHLNRRFHTVIQDMTRSAMVVRLSTQMWDVCDFLIASSGGTTSLAEEVHDRYEDHIRIIESIKNLDVDSARAEMRQHIERNVPMLSAREGAH